MFNRWHGHRLADRARELLDDSRALASERAADADTFIHERPLAATLLGMGAGLVMGIAYGAFHRGGRTASEERPRRRRAPAARRTKRARS